MRLLAHECGFELAGVARAEPHADAVRYLHWAERGLGGAMTYLSDRRAAVRSDPRNLLPTARSVICVGKLYNTPYPHTAAWDGGECGWISRYAWGGDYHDSLRTGLQKLVERMRESAGFDYKICVDTAPLLERSYARAAGLGWIGNNTCLINQYAGSWFFLGELLVSLDLEPDGPAPERCGSCTRCIDACPTRALVPSMDGGYELDARLCISYLTIELKGPAPEALRPGVGRHVFGCDICQDVCPWNGRAALSLESVFQPREVAPPLEKLASLTEQEFQEMFGDGPVARARYTGFLRNVVVAMANSGSPSFRAVLERLAQHPSELVAGHARWALRYGNDR